jgi:hypothetical protein
MKYIRLLYLISIITKIDSDILVQIFFQLFFILELFIHIDSNLFITFSDSHTRSYRFYGVLF